MKKRILIVLACAAVFSLYGCSSKPSEDMVPASEASSESAETGSESEDDASLEASSTSIDGVVIDASMNTLTIQTPETGLVTFDTSAVEEVDLADGLLIGNIVSVSYTGDLEAASAARISDSEKTSFLNNEQLQFAANILLATDARNIELLASFTHFPVYVGLDGGSAVESSDAFIGLGADAVFTDELVEAVTTADLLELKEAEAGVVLGNDEGYNIIFKTDEDGALGIAGINYGTAD